MQVTVYIPTHNRLDLLKRAIASVQAQTYQPIELIVVDDGSSDGTSAYLEALSAAGQLIYLRNATPKGACYARNRAIDVASGDYITGLDDDDAFEPQRVERLVKQMQRGDYSCVTASIVEQTANGRIARPHNTGQVTLDALLHTNVLGNQVLTKTKYLRAVGGFDTQMPAFQDYDTWVRLVARFGEAYKLPSLDYIWYTDHETNRISHNSSKRLQAYARFMEKHSHLMSAQHLKSMHLLRVRLAGERLSWRDFVVNTHRHNWRVGVAMIFNQRLVKVKRVLDSMRMKSAGRHSKGQK